MRCFDDKNDKTLMKDRINNFEQLILIKPNKVKIFFYIFKNLYIRTKKSVNRTNVTIFYLVLHLILETKNASFIYKTLYFVHLWIF